MPPFEATFVAVVPLCGPWALPVSNSHSRSLATVRARNAALASGHTGPLPILTPVAAQYFDSAQPFTDTDWREEQRTREAMDTYVLSMRWRVTVQMPDDIKPWTAYWVGSYSACLHRAHILFKNPSSVTLESAGLGGEMSDSWLPLIVTGS